MNISYFKMFQKSIYKSYHITDISTNTINIPKSCQVILDSIRPILTFCQLLGLLPIQFMEKKKTEKKGEFSERAKQYPLLKANLLSCSGVLSLIIACHLSWMTIWVALNVKSILGSTFNKGTDLYTFSILIQSYFIQSLVIVFNGIYNRSSFVLLYETIASVYHELVVEHKSEKIIKHLNNLKKFGRVVVTLSLLLILIYGVIFCTIAFRFCYSDFRPFKETGVALCPLDNFQHFVEKITYTFITMYHQAFAILFAIFGLLFSIMFLEISEQLKDVIVSFKTRKDGEIEKLRILYAKCSKGAKTMGSVFGVPLLTSCITSIISLTSTIYTISLRVGFETEDVSSDPDGYRITTTSNALLVLWCLHGIFGLYALMLILISGQIVQSSVC